MTIAYPWLVFVHRRDQCQSQLVGFWNLPPRKPALILFILAMLLALAGRILGSMYGA